MKAHPFLNQGLGFFGGLGFGLRSLGFKSLSELLEAHDHSRGTRIQAKAALIEVSAMHDISMALAASRNQ